MSDPNDTQQTLIEHLIELRQRIVKVLWCILGGFFVSWTFSEKVFDFIRAPISPYLKSGLVFTAPLDKFMAHVKVSMLAGMVITAPLWLYQVWQFIAPGLYVKERKYALSFVLSGSLLFLSGLAFVYYLMLPMAFQFLMHFGGSADTPMITITEYLSFFFGVSLAFGLCFELPLILVLLGMMGVVDGAMLSAMRRYAYVGLAALSAIATPPDAISMLMMLLPMVVLYEIAVILVKVMGRKTPTEEVKA